MTLEEINSQIEQITGIPQSLLTGETAEENIAKAKALVAYKRESEQAQPKDTAEQFADYMRAYMGGEPKPDPYQSMITGLDDIQAQMQHDSGFPMVKDGGELMAMGMQPPSYKSTEEQFAEWFKGHPVNSFDPRKEKGWTPLE